MLFLSRLPSPSDYIGRITTTSFGFDQVNFIGATHGVITEKKLNRMQNHLGDVMAVHYRGLSVLGEVMERGGLANERMI